IRFGKAVSRNMAAKAVVREDADVRDGEKRIPKNRRTHREVIVDVSCGCVLRRSDVSFRVEPAHPKARIGGLPVFGEVETVIDQQGSRKRVVANAVAAYPWITQRQREQKD